MSGAPSRPLPHELAAAEVVKGYLKRVEQPPAPRRDMQADWAARLNRARQFDQTKMPAWRDPRGARR
jgi:hypothetical protein